MEGLLWCYFDLYLWDFLVLAGCALVLLFLVVSHPWQAHLYYLILHLHPWFSLLFLAGFDVALHQRGWLIVP